MHANGTLDDAANEHSGIPDSSKKLNPVQNVANHAQQTTSRAKLAQFHHQSLFSPSVATLQKAIKNNQLQSFPGLDQELLKHLPTSTATLKGHMKKKLKRYQIYAFGPKRH